MSKNKWMTMIQKDERNIMCADVVGKERIRTQSPSLDWALGGGMYKGYTTCYYGPEGSGKSLISMMAAGSMMQQDPDGWALVVSTERRPVTPERAAKLGVDPNRLWIREANTIHDVFDFICSDESSFKNSDGTGGGPGLLYMLKEGFPLRALIIDSIKGIRGPKELNADSAEKENMGDMSKFLNPALRQIIDVIRDYNLMTIFVQQVNQNLNADEVKYQNKKYVIPSGQALRHFCETMALVERVNGKAARIESEEKELISGAALREAHTVRVRVEKANLDAPFRDAEFVIDYSKGIINTGKELGELAIALGVVTHPLNDKGGEITAQWIIKNPDGSIGKKWIGKDNFLEELEGDKILQEALFNQIMKVS